MVLTTHRYFLVLPPPPHIPFLAFSFPIFSTNVCVNHTEHFGPPAQQVVPGPTSLKPLFAKIWQGPKAPAIYLPIYLLKIQACPIVHILRCLLKVFECFFSRLICLEGANQRHLVRITIISRSSQQLPRLFLGPLKGFLR